MRQRTLLALVPLALTLLSCVTSQRSGLGTQCDKNSECDVPLVCRLGHCRRECRTSEDCNAPSICLLDQAGLGSCRVESEETCTLESDCPAPLLCRATGCVNQCANNRDCLAGAACEDGTCVEPASRSCARDGECQADEACIAGRCRPQCREDRDCRNGFVCRLSGVFGACVGMDAGLDAAVDAAVDAGLDAPMDATTPTCGTPTAMPLSGATIVASGDDHNCAVATVGGTPSVVCWGAGDVGMVGIGGGASTPCPVVVPGIDGAAVAELALGGTHSCARLITGEVLCWGSNSNGALGLGASVAMDAMPNTVPAVRATSLVAGSSHTCVTRAGMNALCWGLAGQDRLGNGAMSGMEVTPVASTVVPLAQWAGAGLDFTCMGVGTAPPTCFGNDVSSQLGTVLGAMTSGGGRVEGGVGHACAIDMAGDVFCWGLGTDGQLGNPANDGSSRQTATLPTTAIDLAAGDRHTCAVLATGAVHCWGRNDSGQVEPGGLTTPHLTPLVVTLPAAATAVSAGRRHTCAITDPGSVYCWGANGLGQLGDGTTTPSTTIRAVSAP